MMSGARNARPIRRRMQRSLMPSVAAMSAMDCAWPDSRRCHQAWPRMTALVRLASGSERSAPSGDGTINFSSTLWKRSRTGPVRVKLAARFVRKIAIRHIRGYRTSDRSAREEQLHGRYDVFAIRFRQGSYASNNARGVERHDLGGAYNRGHGKPRSAEIGDQNIAFPTRIPRTGNHGEIAHASSLYVFGR